MENQNTAVPEGFVAAPATYFSGPAFIKMLVNADEVTDCSIGEVRFEAGIRNNRSAVRWHVHPSNQILIVKEDTCYYQEEGGPVQKIQTGGVVNILPGIKHWHGASPDAVMVHYAININAEKVTITWLEPVTDEQYCG